MWVYHSSIGELRIVPTAGGRFGFFFDDVLWESCPTPQAQADDVYCHATGCTAWDLCKELGPTDLSEWTYLPPASI